MNKRKASYRGLLGLGVIFLIIGIFQQRGLIGIGAVFFVAGLAGLYRRS